MTEAIKSKTRFEFLLETFNSADERTALQAEYERFGKGHVGVEIQGFDEGALKNAFDYSTSHLDEMIQPKFGIEDVGNELSQAFSWNASLKGDDYWYSVYQKYDKLKQDIRQKRVAAAANAAGSTLVAADVLNDPEPNDGMPDPTLGGEAPSEDYLKTMADRERLTAEEQAPDPEGFGQTKE